MTWLIGQLPCSKLRKILSIQCRNDNMYYLGNPLDLPFSDTQKLIAGDSLRTNCPTERAPPTQNSPGIKMFFIFLNTIYAAGLLISAEPFPSVCTYTHTYSREVSVFSNISVQLLVSSSQVKLHTRQRVHLTQIPPLQLAVPLPVTWTARWESATVFPFISLLSYKITKSGNLPINPLLAPGHP